MMYSECSNCGGEIYPEEGYCYYCANPIDSYEIILGDKNMATVKKPVPNFDDPHYIIMAGAYSVNSKRYSTLAEAEKDAPQFLSKRFNYAEVGIYKIEKLVRPKAPEVNIETISFSPSGC